MACHIVNNKKLDMTNDEYVLYQKIIKSYTTPTNKGEDLFMDLFETDDAGIIKFLRPPSIRQTSLEIFLFLVVLQNQQHMRLMQAQVDDICSQMKTKLKELDNK
jgi:hypothetical protein